MKFEHVDEFRVVGVAARTSKVREMTPDGVIPELWGRMAGQATTALYTEYESDENGEYTFVLGGKSGLAGSVPDGSVRPSAKNLRSYVADFEVYDERASDPANAVVDIYVGVK